MSREAMKLALEALEVATTPFARDRQEVLRAQAALREALAKPDFWEGYVPEPVKPAQPCCMNYAVGTTCFSDPRIDCPHLPPAQQEPVAWTPIDQPYPPGGELDILMGDGSILCEVLPQSDGDLWWGGASTGERFIDPKYASVTHWRIHAEHTFPPTLSLAQRTWQGLTDEERKLVRNSVGYSQFVTAGEYAEHVQKATEFKLMEKNT